MSEKLISKCAGNSFQSFADKCSWACEIDAHETVRIVDKIFAKLNKYACLGNTLLQLLLTQTISG